MKHLNKSLMLALGGLLVAVGASSSHGSTYWDLTGTCQQMQPGMLNCSDGTIRDARGNLWGYSNPQNATTGSNNQNTSLTQSQQLPINTGYSNQRQQNAYLGQSMPSLNNPFSGPTLSTPVIQNQRGAGMMGGSTMVGGIGSLSLGTNMGMGGMSMSGMGSGMGMGMGVDITSMLKDMEIVRTKKEAEEKDDQLKEKDEDLKQKDEALRASRADAEKIKKLNTKNAKDKKEKEKELDKINARDLKLMGVLKSSLGEKKDEKTAEPGDANGEVDDDSSSEDTIEQLIDTLTNEYTRIQERDSRVKASMAHRLGTGANPPSRTSETDSKVTPDELELLVEESNKNYDALYYWLMTEKSRADNATLAETKLRSRVEESCERLVRARDPRINPTCASWETEEHKWLERLESVLEKQETAYRKAQQRIMELEATKQGLTADLTDAQRALNRKSIETQGLQKEIETKNKQLGDQQRTADELARLLKRETEDRKELEKRMGDVERRAAEMEQEKHVLGEENRRKDKKLEDREVMMRKLDDEKRKILEQTNREMESLRRRFDDQEKKNAAARDALERQNEDLRKKFNQSGKKNKGGAPDQSQENAQLRAQLQAMREKLAENEQVLEVLFQNNSEKDGVIARLQQQLAQAQRVSGQGGIGISSPSGKK